MLCSELCKCSGCKNFEGSLELHNVRVGGMGTSSSQEGFFKGQTTVTSWSTSYPTTTSDRRDITDSQKLLCSHNSLEDNENDSSQSTVLDHSQGGNTITIQPVNFSIQQPSYFRKSSSEYTCKKWNPWMGILSLSELRVDAASLVSLAKSEWRELEGSSHNINEEASRASEEDVLLLCDESGITQNVLQENARNAQVDHCVVNMLLEECAAILQQYRRQWMDKRKEMCSPYWKPPD